MECNSRSLTKTKVLQTCSCSVEQKCLMLSVGVTYSVISQSIIQQKKGIFPQKSSPNKVNPNICHAFWGREKKADFVCGCLAKSKYLREEGGMFSGVLTSTVEYLKVNPLHSFLFYLLIGIILCSVLQLNNYPRKHNFYI